MTVGGRGLLLVFAAAIAGCYASHTRDRTEPPSAEEDASARHDAGRRDAGPPPWRDAGRADGGHDAGFDSGLILPEEPEPPVAPGERPSDAPEAEDWVDATPIPGVDPCCHLDPPLEIAPPPEWYIRDPIIEWAGDRWGVFYTALAEGHADGMSYASLDPDATRVLSRRRLTRFAGSYLDGVRWSGGRFGALFGLFNPGFVTLDRNGEEATDPVYFSGYFETTGGSMARQGLGHLWAVVLSQRFEIVGIDGSTEVARHRLDYFCELDPECSEHDVRVEGLKSRVAVIWANGERLALQSVVVGGEGPVGAPLDLGPATVRFHDEHGAYEGRLQTSRFRDSIAITHFTSDGLAWLTLVDPFRETFGRTQIGPSLGQRLGVAASSEVGLIGVCYRTGPRHGVEDTQPDQGVAFRLFGADGAPLGETVQIIDGLPSVNPDCSVGYYEGSFVVLWSEGEQLYARRLRPRVAL